MGYVKTIQTDVEEAYLSRSFSLQFSVKDKAYFLNLHLQSFISYKDSLPPEMAKSGDLPAIPKQDASAALLLYFY